MEIEGPKLKFTSPVSLRQRRLLERIRSYLTNRLLPYKGVIVEDKGLSIGLHYRMVDKTEVPAIQAIFHEATALYLIRDKIRVKSGKMVLEARLAVKWDKGKVVLWLLHREMFAAKDKEIVPVYIGDDVTDEDVFKPLKNKGITVFVGEPKESHAQYYLKDTREVRRFLKCLN